MVNDSKTGIDKMGDVKNGGGRIKLGNIDGFVLKFIRYVSYLSVVCLIGIMLVAFFNVLGEKLFHAGIPLSTQLIQYLHVPVVFLSAAYVTVDRGHVRIDLLSSHFPKLVQNICDVLGGVLGALICGFVGYRGLAQTVKYFLTHKMSGTSLVSFPLWPVMAIFTFGAFLLAFSFLWVLIRKKISPVSGDDVSAGKGKEVVTDGI
jgi:TRAP-type C4-dicarboxylate transport system permease small subunit